MKLKSFMTIAFFFLSNCESKDSKQPLNSNSTAEIANQNGINLNMTTTDTDTSAINTMPIGLEDPILFSLNTKSFTSPAPFDHTQERTHNLVSISVTSRNKSKPSQVPSEINFASDVSPIIYTNCATGGCHRGRSLSDFSTLNDIQVSSSGIKVQNRNPHIEW